jgi:hypothetical protein
MRTAIRRASPVGGEQRQHRIAKRLRPDSPSSLLPWPAKIDMDMRILICYNPRTLQALLLFGNSSIHSSVRDHLDCARAARRPRGALISDTYVSNAAGNFARLTDS